MMLSVVIGIEWANLIIFAILFYVYVPETKTAQFSADKTGGTGL